MLPSKDDIRNYGASIGIGYTGMSAATYMAQLSAMGQFAVADALSRIATVMESSQAQETERFQNYRADRVASPNEAGAFFALMQQMADLIAGQQAQQEKSAELMQSQIDWYKKNSA